MLNMNDAPKQKSFEPIPDGSFVKLILNFKAGGKDMPNCEPADKGLFRAAKDSSKDTLMLECELTVEGGEHAHRKWTEYWVVYGSDVDEKGVSKGWNYTKQRIRAAIESASNIKPDDESAEANAGRMVPNFKELDGMPFYAKLKLEDGGEYIDQNTGETKKGFDKNVIDRIVTPDMEEYGPLVRGEAVAPKPSGRSTKKTAAGGAGAAGADKPRWQKDAAAPVTPTLPHTDTAEAKAPASGPKWLRKA